MQVPVEIIKALRICLANKILAIRRAQEDADAGIDVAGAGDELQDDEVDEQFRQVNGAASATGSSNVQQALRKSEQDLEQAINTCRNRSNVTMEDDHDEDTSGSGAWWGRARACCHRGKVAADKGAVRITRRHYSRQTSARTTLMAAMLWPIAVYCAYFSGTFVWKNSIVEYSRHARSEVLWGKQLEVSLMGRVLLGKAFGQSYGSPQARVLVLHLTSCFGAHSPNLSRSGSRTRRTRCATPCPTPRPPSSTSA